MGNDNNLEPMTYLKTEVLYPEEDVKFCQNLDSKPIKTEAFEYPFSSCNESVSQENQLQTTIGGINLKQEMIYQEENDNTVSKMLLSTLKTFSTTFTLPKPSRAAMFIDNFSL